MNTGPPTSGSQQQAHFNVQRPDTSYYQQTSGNCGAFGQQNTQSQHPGANQPFQPHPGTNPFLAQQQGTTYYPPPNFGAGANQYRGQYPGIFQNSILNLGQFQFGGATQCPGSSKFPRPPPAGGISSFWGNPQFQENKQPFPERKPFPASPFQQMATQFNNGTAHAPRSSASAWENPSNNFTASQCDFQFANLVSSGGQTQTTNVFQFVGPNTTSSKPGEPAKTNVNMGNIGVPKSAFDKSVFLDQNNGILKGVSASEEKKEKPEEVRFNRTNAVQYTQEETGRITNLIRMKHLASSYFKVRNLSALCLDFQTPVFGDFPEGNELEKAIIRNLCYFLKEEIQKIKFFDLEERGRITFGRRDKDPILRASFPVIETVVNKLEIRRRGLQNQKNLLEIAEKQIRGFLEEIKVNEEEAKVLKIEVETEKARIEKLRERLKTERRNNEGIRYQYGTELEQITNVQIQRSHEKLHDLQEKISDEMKALLEEKENLRSWKDRNNNLTSIISKASVNKNGHFVM